MLELIALNARLNIARDRLARIKIVRIGRHDNDGLRRERWASVAPKRLWRRIRCGGTPDLEVETTIQNTRANKWWMCGISDFVLGRCSYCECIWGFPCLTSIAVVLGLES